MNFSFGCLELVKTGGEETELSAIGIGFFMGHLIYLYVSTARFECPQTRTWSIMVSIWAKIPSQASCGFEEAESRGTTRGAKGKKSFSDRCMKNRWLILYD